MLACPYCKRELDRSEKFCPTCRLAVRFVPPDSLEAVQPSMRIGQPLQRLDFRQVAPPAYRSRHERISESAWFEPHAGGVMIVFQTGTTHSITEPSMRERDAAVRASFTAIDLGGQIGVVARRSAIDKARVGYAFNVLVEKQLCWVSTVFESAEHAERKSIKQTNSNAIRPLGQLNVVELRTLGASIEARINDVVVLNIHDPTFGIGSFGIRIGRQTPAGGPPVRVIAHGYDVATVVP